MSLFKITATIYQGKEDIVRTTYVDEKDYEHSCLDDILENEDYFLRKNMSKEFGKSVDKTEWEEIKENKEW